MKRLIYSFSLLMIFAAPGIFAQDYNSNEESKIEYIINLGVFEPGNDYDDINFSNGVGLNIGVLAERKLNSSFNLGIHLGYAGTKGTGISHTWGEGFDYNVAIFDLTLQARFKLANGKIMDEMSAIKPYVIAGFGGAMISNYGLSNFEGEFDNFFASPKINAGIGLEYEINPVLCIGLQIEAITFFNDKIDGHSPDIEANKSNDLYGAFSETIRIKLGR